MKLQPLLDLVVLEREEAIQQTASGIYIPDTAQEKPLRGTIVAIGNKLSEKSPVELGSKVLYKKYAGTETTIEGKDYVIIKESDLLLVL